MLFDTSKLTGSSRPSEQLGLPLAAVESQLWGTLF